MFCAYTRLRYQVSLYRTIGPLVHIMIYWFLAHLSRRLIGELIVYTGIRPPSSVYPSVVHQDFQTTSPLKPLGRFFPYSVYSIYR